MDGAYIGGVVNLQDEVRTGRIIELDGLRGLAALLVLVHHFASEYVHDFPVGVIGVRIFFVLSGFLITTILLRIRQAAESGEQSAARLLGRFYLRRALRLAPVLYLAILACIVLNLGGARSSWPWDFSYLSNFYAIHVRNLPEAVGHFWTLAIEEQFYLVWPWVILFLPRKWLAAFLIGAIIAAPVFRVVSFALGFHWTVIYCLPLGATDALGLGALLAYGEMEDASLDSSICRLKQIACWVGIPMALVGMLAMHLKLERIALDPQWRWALAPVKFYRQVITDSALALVGFVAVQTLIKNPAGAWAALFRWRPLVYLGTISYGIYVYHLPIKTFYAQYALAWFPSLPANGSAGSFVVLTLITLLIASASWHLMERPIVGLKNRLSGPGPVTVPDRH